MIVGIDARIPVFTGRGWGRYTSEIIQAISATGEVELRVLLPRGILAEELAKQLRTRSNVQVAFADFQPKSPDHYWDAACGVTFEAVLGKVDLLHSPTRFVLPTEIRPLVATVHDIAPLSVTPFKPQYRDATLRALAYLLEHKAHLITVSEFTRQELKLQAGFDCENAVVVHHGVSGTFLNAGEQGELPLHNYLLYVGGAGPNKNLKGLIAAARMIRETHPLDLVIAGEPTWDYKELLGALGDKPPSWIRLSGYITDEDLARFYRQAAVLMFPSLHEGFGLPVLEAMACGTPVACSRIPVLEEIAGNAAVYFDPASVRDIAAVVRSLLEDSRLCSELVSRGRSKAREFSWAKAAQKTIDVYRKALGGL